MAFNEKNKFKRGNVSNHSSDDKNRFTYLN